MSMFYCDFHGTTEDSDVVGYEISDDTEMCSDGFNTCRLCGNDAPVNSRPFDSDTLCWECSRYFHPELYPLDTL